MKRILVLLLTLLPAVASAQTLTTGNFWHFVTSAATATAPFGATDFLIMSRGNASYRVPMSAFLPSTQTRKFNTGTPNTGSMSLYVRTAGDDSWDCTSAIFVSGTTGPCRSVQHAYDVLVQQWDMHTTGVFIDVKECASFTGLSAGGIPVGMANNSSSGARIIVIGALNAGNPCTTLTAGPAGSAVSIAAGAPISLASLILTTSSAAPAIFVDTGGDGAIYDSNVVLGNPGAGQPQIQVEGVGSTFTVPGGLILNVADGTAAGALAEGAQGGYVKFDVSSTINFLGTAAYSTATILLNNQGLLGASSTAFTNTGGVTGARFQLNGASEADARAGDLNFIPGNAAGTVCSGSTYRSSTLAYTVAGACAEPQAAFVTSPLMARSNAQLDQTNSTTYADIPGLIFNYKANKFYTCHASLSLTSGAGGGVKVKISTTAASLASSLTIAHGWNGNTAQGGGKTTAIGSDLFATNAVYTDGAIEWTMVTTTDGTVKLQMAQNTVDAATTSVLVNSSMSCIGA